MKIPKSFRSATPMQFPHHRSMSGLIPPAIALINAILLILAAGCRHQTSYSPEIQKMATTMDSYRWDGYYVALDSISLTSLQSRADSALYYMVAYNNHKLSGEIIHPDSLIGFAGDFYTQEGADDKYHAMLAHYLRACSFFDNRMYADAVYLALHVKPLAEELKDTLYLTRFCDIMANSYLKAGNKLEGARYYSEGAKLYAMNPLAADNNYSYFLGQAISNWEPILEFDSIYSLSDYCLPTFLKSRQEIPDIIFIIDRSITSAIRKKSPDYERVVRIMDSVRKWQPEIIPELPEYDILLEKFCRGRIENRIDSAAEALARLDTIWNDSWKLKLPDESHPGQNAYYHFPDVVRAHQEYIKERNTKENQDRMRNRTIIVIMAGSVLLILIFASGVWLHKRSITKREIEMESKTEELKSVVADMNQKLSIEKSSNNDLQLLTDRLFRERLTTLNRLCDNYFIHHSLGDKATSIFYKEFEKRVSELGSRESVSEMEKQVDEYKGGIIRKLREECPGIKEREINLLTFIYAGFSARAICLFMNLSKENFYVMRKRIKDKILKSESPDRQLFIDEMR